ncbi:Helicase conserved C-terminal domain-containing protein [Thermomonospora echinospora]|uniref:Helicase conserved C-terminal domain-containing protein n=1 Tax=Thermomonospora echinospora TaxID=1992 RepID=A0A1H6E8V1_9ACTN|nr:helicase-related protein [Thermomonospora echinospora]SEG94127.1 Helicase conserved C-terminal domain-containing protein [Thermomonospora echinospora]
MSGNGFDEHYAFRAELIGRLSVDLVGPADPSAVEVIGDRPITKYAAGVLFPQIKELVGEETPLDDELEGKHSDIDAAPDPAVAMANVRYPSSMGMTFAVDSKITPTVTITADVARYVPETTVTPVKKRSTEVEEERWRRVPQAIEPQSIALLTPGRIGLPLIEGLELVVVTRPVDAEGHVSVTVALLNKFKVAQGADRDSVAFFQPRLIATGPAGTAPFVERPAPGTPDGDEELDSYRLLYRHAPTFATGHGCAVEWEYTANAVNSVTGSGGASSIRTTFVPKYDLWLADSNPAIDTAHLGMRHLATAPAAEVVEALRGLTQGYRAWIQDRRTDIRELRPQDLAEIASGHLDLCEEACDRMDAGIMALSDETVMRAFRLANRAMAMQRARTDWLRSPDRSSIEPDESTGVWRPFQIAFLLLSLRGIVDKDSPDHEIADVLWFPTGGGKTEAYLGLIAFTVFLRRLRNPANGGGMTVLMRYTLRLLTVQQFERAALLICCMEYLRRAQPSDLGPRSEISIGMWVGQGSTPNTLDDAKKTLRKLVNREEVQDKNPVQIRSCPWCGTSLGPRNYKITNDSLVIACGTEACEYKDGLPVHVVDETIYAARPTLIIATADKFASIPWRPETATLFNLTGTEPPPELIIQDELHLISGPLGTLAGLYEATVDRAAKRPKVVASTATIRRAERQGRSLFDREVRQFPPPGVDARDSYFSVETRPENKASRMYVGLMAPATSQTTLLVRAYAALLHGANVIEADDRTRDPYWTLLGYFNSLRLLAGAKLQVQDDVTDRLGLLAQALQEKKREIQWDIELTSREPSSAIPRHLQDMARSLPAPAVDVILATNMISVGVDVDRLGLMVVMGQPQSTSEYIQATSRVGRRWPGLVVTLFNAARSRDRSHYESFTAYHSALYRQVEATSVTPFSARARDRGLHAVVIGLARLLIPQARPNQAAAAIGDFEEELRDICDKVLERVGRTAGQAERDATEKQIDEIIEQWLLRAEENPDLLYSDHRSPGDGLLIDAGRYDETNDEISETLPTLWSLRDVDVESKFYLL